MRGHFNVVGVGGVLLLLLPPILPLGGHLHPGELAGPVVLTEGLHLEHVLPSVVPKVLCLYPGAKFNISLKI